jgi:hypothetical protein
MSFSINEDTQYIKPVRSVENVYGRDINFRQVKQQKIDINLETKLQHSKPRRNHYFGQDKLTPKVPGNIGIPKGLYYNLNDRLISSQTNYCKVMEEPDKIWKRYENSSPNFINNMLRVDIQDDPRFLSNPDVLGNFTSIYKKSR